MPVSTAGCLSIDLHQVINGVVFQGHGGYLRVIMALVGGRVGTEEIKVLLVVHIPHKHPISLTEDHRDGSIVMGTILVFPLNELRPNCTPNWL